MTAPPAEPPRSTRKARAHRTSRKSLETAARILQAAREVVGRHGYHHAKMGDIAHLAGLHVTALAYHFPSKDAVISAMLTDTVATIRAKVRGRLAELPATLSPRQRIEAAAAVYMECLAVHSADLTAYYNAIDQVPEEIRVRQRADVGETFRFWREMLVAAADGGAVREDISPDMAAQILIGLLTQARSWFNPLTASPATTARQLISILFEGIEDRARR